MAEARWIATRWIAARDGLRPEMDDKRWIPSGDAVWPDMDRDWIWMDDRRWISGDGSWETDDNQSPFLYEATKLQSSADMQTYDVLPAIPNKTAICPSYNAEYDPVSDPEPHSYNADTAHHEAVRD